MRSTCSKVVFATLVFLFGWVGTAGAGEAGGTSVYYLVFEADETGLLTPLFARTVELAAPLESKSDEVIQEPETLASRRDGERLALRLEAADGSVVYRDVVEVPEWIRGEFHGQQTANRTWTIDGHRIQIARRAFVVRVPVVEGASLVLEGKTRSTFDLDTLEEESRDLPLAHLAAPAGAVVTRAARAGDPANRVDLLLMGDGYIAAEEALFNAHIDEFDFWFFLPTPYAEYKNFVNANRYFVPSTESGADHPPYDPTCVADDPSCCADAEAIADPLAGTYVDTAFDARFCSFNVHRLLVVDVASVFAAASAVPDWDMILVAVNDPTYGGAGGPVTIASIHDDALEIAQHEFGHSFTNLADEYDTPYPGYPPCSDVTGPVCEANVTDETVRSLIKWLPWIDATTPVPTPEGLPEYATVTGLFEGARYQPTGMYRPSDFSCMMNQLAESFCAVCSQEYVLQLYRGGWGVPLGGIDLIEPGTENPPTGPVVDGTAGVSLSVGLLHPVGSPPLGETWLVDDVPQPAPGVPGTFDFLSSEPGTHFGEIRVEDLTALVHPDMTGGLLESSRVWEIDVGLAAGPGRVGSLEVGKSTTTPGDLVLDWAAGCSPGAVDYAIYEGTLGNFYSHAAADCTDDGDALTEEIQPGTGDTYYLVVPLTAGAEGSYGASSWAERPQGIAACRATQVIAACP
jgi:hypothetical protein